MNIDYQITVTRLRKRSSDEVQALQDARKERDRYGSGSTIFRDDIGNDYPYDEYEAERVLRATLTQEEYDAMKKAIIASS